jgi:4-hydroxy-2-oxoglutarate aldolase
MLLEGVFPALTTPFYPNGDLYLRKLEHNVARYSRTQLSGMVVLGSTGEAVLLDMDEQREILQVAIQAAAPEKVMIAGVGQESVRHTIALAERAAALQYDAVLVRTPHFYRKQLHRSDRPPLEMLTYFRTVADHSPLPVLLYSVPAFTQYDLPVEVIAELAHHENILGIKDSSGKPERIAEIVAATQFRKRKVPVTNVFTAVTARMLQSQPVNGGPTFITANSLSQGATAIAAAPPPAALKIRQKEVGFSVLTGGAATLHSALEAGASGAVLAFAACAPQCCYEVFTAWKEGDPALAEEKQQRIRQASLQVGAQMGVPGLKFACDLNGYYGGRPRLPLLPLTLAEQETVQAMMADIRY